MLSIRIPILVLTTVLLGAPALADHDYHRFPGADCDLDAPALAVSPEGHALLAWVVDGCDMFGTDIVQAQLVPDHHEEGEVLPPTVSFGPGTLVDVCWSHEGYTLAMVSGEFVVIYQSDTDGVFDTEEFVVRTPFPGGTGITDIDLWGNPNAGAAGAHVLMTAGGHRYVPDSDYPVRLAKKTGTDWSSFELVADGFANPCFPQVSWGIGAAGPAPMVYWLAGTPDGDSIFATTWYPETGWDEPTAVPGPDGLPSPFGGPFDVDRDHGDQIAILGLGPALACPCGSIHHVEHEEAGDWTDPQELTVDYFTDMDWPMSPDVEIGADGRIHAFWYQQGSVSLMPRLRTLEYWVGDGVTWTDAGTFPADYQVGGLGSRVAMALTPEDEPLFAFTRKDTVEGVPQARAIWLARPEGPVGPAPDGLPGRRLTLTARPNPFNPQTVLAYTLERDGAVELAIYDPAGRQVRRLAGGLRRAGDHTAVWDGRDDRGRPLISGVYVARVRTADGDRSVKLMLVR